MGIERFEQLEVWQIDHQLVLQVYQTTARYPNEEKFGLVAQMRRAAISVPANIAEGFKRRGPGDKIRFYNIVRSSLEEVRYYFILSRDLGYDLDYPILTMRADSIARMLTNLIKAIRS